MLRSAWRNVTLCVWTQMLWRNLQFCLEILCTSSIDVSTNSQNLRNCRPFSPKTVLIFPENFHNFKSIAIGIQGIIILSCYSSKGYASVVLSDSGVAFLQEKGVIAVFLPYLNCESSSSNFIQFYDILLRLYNAVLDEIHQVWFVWFYGISTFVGYLTPNPF